MKIRKTMLAASIAATLLLGTTGSVYAQSAPGSQAASGPDHNAAQANTATQAAPPSTATPAGASSTGQPAELEGVTVTGVRASQMKSVMRKRVAPDIQDSITAENIGELPDATIADSLQRITGVQISRTAGEGDQVSVRGMPQVGTTINGEAFIPAGQIVTNQPNFSTIPSQLFSGADVVKSSTAGQVNAGITGTINLRTRRPWDMKDGWTFSAAAKESHGTITDKYQPGGNAFLSYNDGGKWGALLGVAISDTTRAQRRTGNDEQGGLIVGEAAPSATASTGFLGSFGGSPIPSDIHQLGGGNVDVNGNGKATDAFWASQAAVANNSNRKRRRVGINAAIQGDLGHGLTLTADGFFSKMNDYDRNMSAEIFSSTFQGASFVPVVSHNTGDKAHVVGYDNNLEQDFNTTQVYKKWPGDIESYSQTTRTNSRSRNFDLILKYDNGGAFHGDIRAVRGEAHQSLIGSYVQFSLGDGSQWPNDPADAAPPGSYVVPGGTRVFNANGLPANSVPIIYDMRGTDMAVTAPEDVQELMRDPKNYALKTVSTDNAHNRKTGMTVLRADGHYDLSGDIHFLDTTMLDFGVRNSIRTASNFDYYLGTRVYAGKGASDPDGCLVHWKAADVVLNGGGVDGTCTAGNSQGYFRANPLVGLTPSELPDVVSNNMRYYKHPGNASGFGIWGLDPRAMDNPRQFQEALYPGEEMLPRPSATWNLKMQETAAYVQANFGGQIGSVPFSGNIGVRAVRTNLHIVQSIVGESHAYGVPASDNGAKVTNRQYTDILPAVNLSFSLTPKMKLRVAYAKNMMPVNLDQLGGGLDLRYNLDTSTSGSTRFIVTGGHATGNPELKPWRSKNYNVSLEYYLTPTSIVSLAGFYIKVDSFIQRGSTLQCDLPDLDGTVSGRCVPIDGLLQGEGKSLHGAEFDYSQAFTFLPGFLSNTGATVNFTYAPSDAGGHDLAGNKIPFQDNSKKSGNLILWYQNDRFQFRTAMNYRSRRAVESDFSGQAGLEEYQAKTVFVDAQASYKVSPHVQLFLQGENLTGEHQRYYLTYPGQVAHTIDFERRYELGVRATF